MPKYAYRCSSCDKEWTEWRLISESLPLVCPHCEGGTPYKLPPNTIFKEGKTEQVQEESVGKLVEEAIVEAKEEFKKHIKEYREKDDDRF
tara:strand:- start:2640 stop:2909 length:270 start_codon:yes stop_codon:yes gene_type:complete